MSHAIWECIFAGRKISRPFGEMITNPNIVTTTQLSYAEFLSRVITSLPIGTAGKRWKFGFHASQLPVVEHFGTEALQNEPCSLERFSAFFAPTQIVRFHILSSTYIPNVSLEFSIFFSLAHYHNYANWKGKVPSCRNLCTLRSGKKDSYTRRNKCSYNAAI